MELTLAGYEHEAARLQGQINRLRSEIGFRKEQLDAARKLGKTAFDAEKFMIVKARK